MNQVNSHRPGSHHPLSRGRKLLFVGSVILFVGFLQEAVFRWMFPLPEVVGFNRLNYSPLRSFDGLDTQRQQGLSNVRFRWESAPDGFAFDHTLNLYGFRGPVFSVAPLIDRPRVLFVGDSFVEGCGASDEDTIPRQLSRQADEKIEAINLGVKGTGFPEYIRIVRDGVDLLHPHTVFVVVCWNDLPTAPLDEERAETPPSFSRSNPFMPRVVALMERFWAGLVVPRRYLSGPLPYVQPVPSPTNPLTVLRTFPPHLDPEIRTAMSEGKLNPALLQVNDRYQQNIRVDLKEKGGAEAYLRRMKSYCQRNSARLVVVYIPYHITVNPEYAAAQNRLGGFQYSAAESFADPMYRRDQRYLSDVTRALEIPFIDTTPEFATPERTGRRMFWPVDGHCNAAGYQLVARLCARYRLPDPEYKPP
jgi:lysophospholipase L1-like esterase